MINETIKETTHKMDVTVESTRTELQTVRTGRANVSLLDRVMVEAYETQMPINQLASITAPEARLILIQPFDKTQLAAIEKGIMQSDLGLTPSNDGNVIRLPIPQLTEDRRRELIKVVNDMIEHGRVAVRNVRREANEDLKRLEKEHEVSEDDLKRALDKIRR